MNDYGWIGRFTHSACRNEDWSLNSTSEGRVAFEESSEPLLFDADGLPLVRDRRAGFVR